MQQSGSDAFGIRSQAEKWLINPRWRTIRHLGRLPILGISAATIVLVPLLTKGIGFLQKWSEHLATTLSQNAPQFANWLHALSGSLTLPFVLKLLALSALFAIVGKIIYIASCPPYIKYGDSFHEFRHAHSDALAVMTDAFLELWNDSDERRQKEIGTDWLNSYAFSFFTDVRKSILVPGPLTQDSEVGFRLEDFKGQPRIGTLKALVNNPTFGEAIFILLRESRDDSRRFLRTACAIFYYVATYYAGRAILIQGEWIIRGALG